MPIRLTDPAPDAYDYPLLLKQLLPDPCTTHSEIVSGGERFTYVEQRDRIGRLGEALTALGVGPGMTVAVMGWDDHRYLECYFAIPMLGAVLQTVNVRLSPEQIVYTLQQAEARVLLYHPDFEPLVAAISAHLPLLETRILLADAGGRDTLVYERLIAAGDPAFAFPDFDERAVATTFHTTGTTGLPKAVSFSHRQLVLHTLALGTALANQPLGQGFRRDDVYMPLTPLFHVHAWGLPFLATMLGSKQVYPGRYDPATIVALKHAEGVTFSHCVPTILQMILATRKAGDPPFDRWTMVIGGSALSSSLAADALAAGIRTVAGYGMSETGPVIALARSATDNSDTLRHAGLPLPLVRMRIQAPGDVSGELVLRAPWLTQGYAGQPEASADLWRDGWLHTQDVADITAWGECRIVDRLKDVIKTGGEWLSSPQLEELAMQHPGIAAVAFIGVSDERWGERPVAFIVPAADADPATIDVRAHLADFVRRGVISRYALPDHVIPLAALPTTSVGKIDKKVLRQLFPTMVVPAS